MKKHFYLLLAFCLIVTGANAQTITNKELQGRWNLLSCDLGGIILDLKTDQIRFSDEVSESMDQEAQDALVEGMAETLAKFREGYIEFTDNKVTVFLETPDTAVYTLTQKDGVQHIAMTYDEDTTVDDFEIALIGKELHLTIEEEEAKVEFVYLKK